MPRYSLVIARRFRQDLRRLDTQMHRRVLEALERLQEDPFQGQRLTNVAIGQWRIRVGDYRVVYTIRDEVLLVLVVRVAHRKDAYRGH